MESPSGISEGFFSSFFEHQFTNDLSERDRFTVSVLHLLLKNEAILVIVFIKPEGEEVGFHISKRGNNTLFAFQSQLI